MDLEREYITVDYDVNRPSSKVVSVPLDSQYGLAVKVYKDGEQAQLSSSQISVDGQDSSETLRGYHLFELSSGSTPCVKQFDVEVDKQERRTIEGTREVDHSPNNTKAITFYLQNRALDDMTIKAADLLQVVGECEISATSGDIAHETLGLSDLWVFGRDVPGAQTIYYWHVVDGKWENETGDKTTDTIYSVLTTLSAARFITKQKYGKGTATCQYSIVLRTSDDIVSNFKLNVQETDMGRIRIKDSATDYITVDYDISQPSRKVLKVPLDSDYNLAVRVFKDGEQVELSGTELLVDEQQANEVVNGYSLFDLSTGSTPCTNELNVEVNKSSGEIYDFEDTITARQPLDRTTSVTINVGTFLSGYEVSPQNVKMFEMTSTLTPDAGGDPVTETYDINDLQFYGKEVGSTQSGLWWHVKDGQWEDQAKTGTCDTITLGVIGTRNVTAKTKNTYPKSTGTATFKLVFKFGDGEDIATNFKLNVNETDIGYIEVNQ